MPAAIHYSHKILQSMAEARHKGEADILGPDSKSQITLEHIDGNPVRATSVVVSTQHSKYASQKDIKELVRKHVVKVLPEGWMCEENRFFVRFWIFSTSDVNFFFTNVIFGFFKIF